MTGKKASHYQRKRVMGVV